MKMLSQSPPASTLPYRECREKAGLVLLLVPPRIYKETRKGSLAAARPSMKGAEDE